MKQGKRNTLTIVLLVIYLLVLTGIILFKLPFRYDEADRIREINLIPLMGSFDDNGVIRLSEIVGNILVFIPLGIYICMLKSKWPFVKKVLPIIGLTLAFEIIQYIFSIGRTDITDILGNTLGGITGIGIYALLFRIFKNRTIKVVNIFALASTICALLFFAFLFFISHQVRVK